MIKEFDKYLKHRNECAIIDGRPELIDNKIGTTFDFSNFCRHYDLNSSKVRNLYVLNKKHSKVEDTPAIDFDEYLVMFDDIWRYVSPFCENIAIKNSSIPLLNVLRRLFDSLSPDDLSKMRNGVEFSTLSPTHKKHISVICNYFYVYRETTWINIANSAFKENNLPTININPDDMLLLEYREKDNLKKIPIDKSSYTKYDSRKTEDSETDILLKKNQFSLKEYIEKLSKANKVSIRVDPVLHRRSIIVLGDDKAIPIDSMLRHLTLLLGVKIKRNTNGFELFRPPFKYDEDVKNLYRNLLNAIPAPVLKYSQTPAMTINYWPDSIISPEARFVLARELSDKRNNLVDRASKIIEYSKYDLNKIILKELKANKTQHMNINDLSSECKASLCRFFIYNFMSKINSNFTAEQDYITKREDCVVKAWLSFGSNNKAYANFYIVSPRQNYSGAGAELVNLWLDDPQNAPRSK